MTHERSKQSPPAQAPSARPSTGRRRGCCRPAARASSAPLASSVLLRRQERGDPPQRRRSTACRPRRLGKLILTIVVGSIRGRARRCRRGRSARLRWTSRRSRPRRPGTGRPSRWARRLRAGPCRSGALRKDDAAAVDHVLVDLALAPAQGGGVGLGRRDVRRRSAAAPSRRCSHSRWPPSSTMAMVTAQLFLSASASAAAAMALTSASSRIGLVFMDRVSKSGKTAEHNGRAARALQSAGRHRGLRPST